MGRTLRFAQWLRWLRLGGRTPVFSAIALGRGSSNRTCVQLLRDARSGPSRAGPCVLAFAIDDPHVLVDRPSLSLWNRRGRFATAPAPLVARPAARILVEVVSAKHAAPKREQSLRQGEERMRLMVEAVLDYAIFTLDR